MLNKIKTLSLAIVIFAMTSCQEDFLETVPTDSVTPAIALADEASMQNVLNGIHRGLYSQSQTVLPGGNTARAGDHFWVPQGDNLTGGIIHSADANNLGWRDNMQWNDHTLETSLTNEILWYHRYNIILHANLIIQKINEGSLTETPTLRTIKGQAYTYRAFALLSLVQHYSKGYLIGNPATDPGVPVILEPQTTGPRGTVQQVYDQIGSDLDVAIAAFQNGAPRPSGGPETKSQLNINVAHGLKARWALSKGDWQTAATSAVAARQGFTIMNEADWKSGFNTNDLPEVIWGSNVISTETTFFRSYFYLMCNTFNGSQNRSNPKIADRRIIDAIPDTDYRKDVFLIDAPNSNASAANGEGGWANNTNPLYTTQAEFNAARDAIKSQYGMASGHNTHPYMHVKMLQKNPGTIDPDDIIYMRTSEMYLIEAEAKAMANDLPGARAALQTLGGARDTAFSAAAFSTQQALMNQIKFQRRVELWGEGFGYTDKIRWDEGIDHSANGGSGASAVLYQDAFIVERPSINDDWIFKIPQAEINANPNITPADQN
ncbi:RagB/SusD family nutrient uptake outer membrane protein [Sabulilitoribacter multivorans]|uniref:RagB/SusD family nutrient uptake outer membrane protein n=1 Tax=Flaviramulus multivorans TaxID=1304750 RepID=A0ABS9IKQ2_9FLAO|nr:RagB/SusD family nutrient uptake outer membrane protein [Flaviramulus multivorans]MCF7561158.1 RagB/SusD family nutrient uptake outer membrane protein [Flaviramulus multivorans]